MTIVAERILERLIAIGKNPKDGGQTWLAKKVGMKPQGIQSILAGASEQPRKIREIAAALRTSPEYLLGETDDPKGHLIRGDTEILAVLSRIEDLEEHDIEVAFQVIKNAVIKNAVNRGGQEQEGSRDQREHATPHHEEGPSRKKAPQSAD